MVIYQRTKNWRYSVKWWHWQNLQTMPYNSGVISDTEHLPYHVPHAMYCTQCPFQIVLAFSDSRHFKFACSLGRFNLFYSYCMHAMPSKICPVTCINFETS